MLIGSAYRAISSRDQNSALTTPAAMLVYSWCTVLVVAMSESYVQTLSTEAKVRYEDKIRLIDGMDHVASSLIAASRDTAFSLAAIPFFLLAILSYLSLTKFTGVLLLLLS